MKILHTSDWHLGHTLYNYDRTAEQQAFLRQLACIVAEEQPDAMVVSGDIYHYSAPAAATQKMYTDAMLDIHQACPGMTIVVTAGNHDSSSKLEIDSSLWQHFGLNVVGNIERTAEEVNLDKHIIEVKNEKGTTGYVIAVPHVYPQNFPLLDSETPRDQRQARFFQALLDEVKKRNTAQLPVVLMAHLSIEGSDRSGHDESIGGIEYVPLSAMGEGYDYLALGHIHCPQDIKGSHHHARYCGTPSPSASTKPIRTPSPSSSWRKVQNHKSVQGKLKIQFPSSRFPMTRRLSRRRLEITGRIPGRDTCIPPSECADKRLPATRLQRKSLERRQRQGMQILLHQDHPRAAG